MFGLIGRITLRRVLVVEKGKEVRGAFFFAAECATGGISGVLFQLAREWSGVEAVHGVKNTIIKKYIKLRVRNHVLIENEIVARLVVLLITSFFPGLFASNNMLNHKASSSSPPTQISHPQTRPSVENLL